MEYDGEKVVDRGYDTRAVIRAATEECLMSVMALNLKRLIKAFCFVLYYAFANRSNKFRKMEEAKGKDMALSFWKNEIAAHHSERRKHHAQEDCTVKGGSNQT